MMKQKGNEMSEKETLKFLENNAKFIQKESKYLRSYYFHKRNEWLFYIPFYQVVYLWKTTLFDLNSNELIKSTAQLNIDLEKYYRIRCKNPRLKYGIFPTLPKGKEFKKIGVKIK